MTRQRSVAVVGVAAATLAFEILLVRVFAIAHFHHMASMAIGIAMLGFGVSGTAVALARPSPERSGQLFWWACVALTVTLVVSPALVHLIALDASQLAWDVGQWLRLGLVYLALALPFMIGGLAILLAIMLAGDRPGATYGASFLGSGIGAVVALVVLWVAMPDRALAVPIVVAAVATGAVALDRNSSARQRGIALVLLGGSLVAVAAPPWRLAVSSYKALPQVERFPEARRLATRTHPLGWTVAVEAPAFRYAPGLSLRFHGEVPPQVAVFVDGGLTASATTWPGSDSARAFLAWLPAALPHAVGRRDRVLIVGGGATGAAVAEAHGADRITVLELHPHVADLSHRLGGFLDADGAEPEWVVDDARRYLARSQEAFDLIAVGPSGALGTAAAGVHALSENFRDTREAYVQYLSSLRDDGVLSVTGWLAAPPRENVRVILTTAEALRHLGRDVASGLVVVRSWGTVTVMVKPAGYRPEEIATIRSWAAARNFDVDFPRGAPGEPYNVIDQPVFEDAAAAAAAGSDEARRFAEGYPFDVAPVGDVRPYPGHFLRLRSLGAFLRNDRGAWLPFAEWGVVVSLATLVQSVLLAVLLLIVPVVVRGRRGEGRTPWRVLLYFGAIGFAYLAAEIAAIQQLSLLLGHPVYAVVAVLAMFLVCSGAGSLWSDRWSTPRPVIVTGLLMVALVVLAFVLPAIVPLLQAAPLPIRGMAAFAVLGPVAVVMGMPFPVGLRAIAKAESGGTAWAWASNGFASVTAASVSALMALTFGVVVLVISAGVGYGVAALTAQGMRR